MARGVQSSVPPRIRSARATLRSVSTVLATLPDDVARKVAEDRLTYGEGYVRIDAEGRAHHVPAYLFVRPERDDRAERRMHE